MRHSFTSSSRTAGSMHKGRNVCYTKLNNVIHRSSITSMLRHLLLFSVYQLFVNLLFHCLLLHTFLRCSHHKKLDERLWSSPVCAVYFWFDSIVSVVDGPRRISCLVFRLQCNRTRAVLEMRECTVHTVQQNAADALICGIAKMHFQAFSRIRKLI